MAAISKFSVQTFQTYFSILPSVIQQIPTILVSTLGQGTQYLKIKKDKKHLYFLGVTWHYKSESFISLLQTILVQVKNL